MVPGHVRTFLNFVALEFIFLLKIVQAIKNVFFKTGFFPVILIKILRYIQHAFSSRIQPIKPRPSVLLSYSIRISSRLFRHVTLLTSFKRFDWSLAIGYLVSINMASLLWTYEDKKFNTINVILCPAGLSNSLSFDTNSYVNKNYQIKWYGQGRRRRLLWISFQLTVLLKLFIHRTFVNNSLWKRELAELFRIPCFWERSLVIISVTKPIWYRDAFVKIFCSPTFRLGNSLVIEPLFSLII